MKVMASGFAGAAGIGRHFRMGLVALALAAVPMSALHAQISIGIGVPGLSIGINFPQAPEFVRVPGYPAYYAPQAQANLFFYDGLYWVYVEDYWYAGSWYNGPWTRVAPQYVPLYLLRIPVRYYRAPPEYFRRWRPEAPPRWDEHWGNGWARDHRGWDQWDRRRVPAPAPLPSYQRQYQGDRYPTAERQQELLRDNYRYQPRDAVVRQHFQQPAPARAPAPTRQPLPLQTGDDPGTPQYAPGQRAPARQQQPPQGGDDPGSHQRAQPQAQPQRSPQQRAQPQPVRPAERGVAPESRREPPGQARKDDKPDKPDKGDRGDKGDKNDEKDRRR